MKVVVLNEFRDKARFALVHHIGETLEVDEERGKTLISLHLVEEWKEIPETPPTEGSEEDTQTTDESSEVNIPEETTEEVKTPEETGKDVTEETPEPKRKRKKK
jgi:outer membrane biosynthesis protein TonB